jgi:DNA transposition AAA+ family ATPase
MNSPAASVFVETKEYRRFVEFCEACRRDRYIGVCYGPPGVGKTFSARHYATWDWEKVTTVSAHVRGNDAPGDGVPLAEILRSDAIFYTAPVVNSPRHIERHITLLRNRLHDLHRQHFQQEQWPRIEEARQWLEKLGSPPSDAAEWNGQEAAAYRRAKTTLLNRQKRYEAQWRELTEDPTGLIIIDEVDWLKITGLEQVRDIFDRGRIGVILIGMPGIQKRLARYPQLHSRVGFAHEFRPLPASDLRRLLQQGWRPPGIVLPARGLTDETAVASILRITGGNFRLIQRLLTQIARVLKINDLDKVTAEVVETAAQSLVIGTD